MTPRLLALLLLCVGLAAHASGPDKPSRADLQKALELHERSVVRVVAPRRSGPGVIVGSQGQVLTAVDHVSMESTEVEFDGKRLPASVVVANAYLKVAVVAAPSGTYPSVPVKLVPEGLDGQWLIGVVRAQGKRPAQPFSAVARRAKQEPFVDLDLPFTPGSPLFDTQGRLVAIVVQRRPTGCRALPLSAVKVQLASAARSP